MIDIQHDFPVRIPGVIEGPSFTIDALWPNELGEKPEDLIGRNVRQDDNYFVIVDIERISPTGHKCAIKPYRP